MKITKEGRDPEERIWIGYCDHCGTEMEGTFRELKVRHEGFKRRKSVGYIYGHNCLTCNKFVEFRQSQRPPEST